MAEPLSAVPTVDDVIVTPELFRAAPAPSDHAAETEALLALSRTLNQSPEAVAQALADAAMQLTGAHSAGVSLTDTSGGERLFRWIATAGEYARYAHGTMPYDASPCGTVLARRQPLLMREPQRFFPSVRELHAPVRLALLVPFGLDDALIGTVWVVTHDERKVFTAEDLRIVQSLASFASAVSATVGLLGDLRARQKVHAQLLAASEASLQRMGDLFRHAPGFVAVLRGSELVLELANDAWVALVGRRDMIGRPLLEALPELAHEQAVLARVLSEGRSVRGRDVALRLRRSGDEAEERFVDLVYQPVTDSDGTVGAVLVQGHDVTDRHRAEQAVQAAQQRKDDFIAMLAHELRNPLAPLRFSAQILKRGPGAEDARHRQAVQMIETQTGFITRLVDDLLDLSRVRSGKVVLERERVRLQEVVAQCVEAIRPQTEAKEQVLRIHAPPEPVWVLGDRARLAQVLLNVLGNAVKYSHRGATVRVELATAGDCAELRVADNGNGIAPEVLPHIFDMYVQAPELRSQRQGGLGIGLAVVRHLARLHGGTIEAHSDGPGHGATFTIRLPVAG